jgi:putative hydrolase of the HAD superfamily
LLGSRWTHYRKVNETRDHALCRTFWRELTEDWLARLEAPATALEPIMAVADELLYGSNGSYFEPFEDVAGALDDLRERGVEAAVISNWDYSLHRVLASLGMGGRFRVVLASLEEGVEKPETRLFEIALERMGFAPEEALHVGDNPIDDVEGARRAGMRAVLLDRALEESEGNRIATLRHLTETPAWNA